MNTLFSAQGGVYQVHNIADAPPLPKHMENQN